MLEQGRRGSDGAARYPQRGIPSAAERLDGHDAARLPVGRRMAACLLELRAGFACAAIGVRFDCLGLGRKLESGFAGERLEIDWWDHAMPFGPGLAFTRRVAAAVRPALPRRGTAAAAVLAGEGAAWLDFRRDRQRDAGNGRHVAERRQPDERAANRSSQRGQSSGGGEHGENSRRREAGLNLAPRYDGKSGCASRSSG